MDETNAIVTQTLREEITTVLAQTNSAGIMLIDTAVTAQTASNMINALASVEKKIKAVFKEPKEQAYARHKAIASEEKKLLAPLEEFEKDLRNKLGAYQYKLEQERRRAEEEAQRKAEEEANRKMQEAMRLEEERKAAEAAGDTAKAEELAIQAQAAVDEADAIDTAADMITIAPSQKPTGVSFRTDYEIVAVDYFKLPCIVNNTPIVKIDESVVKRMIKDSKGTIQIEGLTYKEVPVTVRR